MQRYTRDGLSMVPTDGGAWVRFDTAQAELTAALDEGKAQYDRAELLRELATVLTSIELTVDTAAQFWEAFSNLKNARG